MPRPLRALALSLLAIAGGCATGEELHPDAPVLKSLRFEGNDTFSDSDLRDGLVTQEGTWLPFTRPARFDPAAFQGDLARIVNYYKARGYFDARVRHTNIVPAGTNAVRVTVVLEEGSPSAVRKIDLTGIDALSAEVLAELRKPLPLVAGAIFTEEKYQATKSELLRRLHENAFAQAALEGRADVDLLAHAVDLTFAISSGPHYAYSRFVIRGNSTVPTYRIQQEIDGVMKKGDDFQTSDLDEAQKRIFDLGVFSNAQVQAGTPDPDAGTLPVVVDVAEAPFHTFRAGAGVGIDVEHQEVHVTGGFTDRNFLGGLRRLDFDNTVALEWLPSVFDQIESAVPAFKSTLKLTQPEIFSHNTDLVPSLQVERAAELGFGYWAFRGSVGVPWKILPSLTFTPAYRAEVLVFDSGTAFSGIDLSPAALLSLSCQVCVLSYLEQTLIWDRRDDKTEPRSGFLAQLDVQEAGGPLGGSFSNTRFLPEVRAYFPLGKRDVLAVRLQLGALFTYGGTTSPVDQRFFLGGIDSVRGYGAERLSPMVRVNTCAPIVNPKNPGGARIPSPLCQGDNQGVGIVDVQVGGNGMIEGSLELRHTLSDIFHLVAFVDTGEVTEQPFAFDFSAQGLAITPGLGLRVITPIGALRADFAYRATDPIRPVSLANGTFPQPGYAVPSTAAGAMDGCAWPAATTGWGGYAHPSTCKSEFLNRFAFNIAIGEAF
jgi:translocation and assembly module TamA